MPEEKVMATTAPLSGDHALATQSCLPRRATPVMLVYFRSVNHCSTSAMVQCSGELVMDHLGGIIPRASVASSEAMPDPFQKV